MIISASYSIVATLLDPIAPLAQVDPLTLAAELLGSGRLQRVPVK